MKKCTKCHELKDESEFYKNKQNKDGLHIYCKKCARAISRQWQKDNPEIVKQMQQKKLIDDPEYNKKQCKKYRTKNATILKQKQQNKYKENPSYFLSKSNKWKKDNPEYRNNYEKQRKANDPLHKLKCKIRTLIHDSLQKQGYTKQSRTYQLLGCSYEDLMLYLGTQSEYNMSLDHICPCAQAQNEEELIKLQHYTNFRWMNLSKNSGKNDNWTPEGEELCVKLLNRPWIYKTEINSPENKESI